MRIYCGTEDYVNFFKQIIEAIGLAGVIDYQVVDVDGELEIEMEAKWYD